MAEYESLASLSGSEYDSSTFESSAHSNNLTISPPSYSVRETRDGRFYNTTLDMAWPERPQEGYYSKNEYYRRRCEMVELRNQKWVDSFGRASQKDSVVTSLLHPDFLADLSFRSPKWFLGQVSPLKAAESVKPQKCAVFYPLNEPDLGDVPLVLQPILAYKNQQKEVYFFELEFNDKMDMWYLQFLNYKSPGFSRLKQLVEYVSTTGFLSPEGLLESLPVWDVDKHVSV